MQLNQFQIYSKVSTNDTKIGDFEKNLEKIETLQTFKTESDARKYINETWMLKDDITNFNIAPNVLFSSKLGKKYFNVTFVLSKKDEKVVKSINFVKSQTP